MSYIDYVNEFRFWFTQTVLADKCLVYRSWNRVCVQYVYTMCLHLSKLVSLAFHRASNNYGATPPDEWVSQMQSASSFLLRIPYCIFRRPKQQTCNHQSAVPDIIDLLLFYIFEYCLDWPWMLEDEGGDLLVDLSSVMADTVQSFWLPDMQLLFFCIRRQCFLFSSIVLLLSPFAFVWCMLNKQHAVREYLPDAWLCVVYTYGMLSSRPNTIF